MKTLFFLSILIATCTPLLAQSSDRREVRKLQKRINAEERLRRKQQKEREKAARNLRATATINATAKVVKALLVQETTELGWTLTRTDDFTIIFSRPAGDSELVATKLGAAMGGHPEVEHIDDLVRFTVLDLDGVVTVTTEIGKETGTAFKDTTNWQRSRDGRFNLQMQDLLDRVKERAERQLN
jgi:hypothetical protein